MPENLPLLQIVGTVLISIISAVGAWAATRSKGKVDIQAAMNTGFISLTERQNIEWDRLAKERDRIAQMADEKATRLEALEEKLDKRETELDEALRRCTICDNLIKEHEHKISLLLEARARHRAELNRLFKHIAELENSLRMVGVEPPPLPDGIAQT